MRNYIGIRNDRYNETPENLDSERCRKKIDAILDDPNGYKVTDEYNHDDVRTILKKYFGSKCVYCEGSPIATSTFRIDHYRPKKNVKDCLHTGYYWLAYEWTNLLQSCQLCNGVKSNYFPLKEGSVRIDAGTPGAMTKVNRKPTLPPLNTEERLLLHPELDNVEEHLYFEWDGTIKSDSLEGNKSIECYGLQRNDLVFFRKQIRDEFLVELKEALRQFEVSYSKGVEIAKEILFTSVSERLRKFLRMFSEHKPYSLFYFYMFDKFETFFIDEIEIQEHKEILQEMYETYKSSNS